MVLANGHAPSGPGPSQHGRHTIQFAKGPICSFLLGRALRAASCGLEDKARSAGVGALDYGLNGLVAPVIRHRQDLRRSGLRSRVEGLSVAV